MANPFPWYSLPGYPTPWKGPGTRNTLPPAEDLVPGIPYPPCRGPGTRDTLPSLQRTWYQGYPTLPADELVPVMPYPLQRTWYQGYPTLPAEDLVPVIPYPPCRGPGTRDSIPPELNDYHTPLKTLPSTKFIGGR